MDRADMSISKNDEFSLGQIEGLLTQILSVVRPRQSETSNAPETTVNGGWIFTLVGKDCENRDTGPAELASEDRLIETIKRLLEQDEETTHIEIHEGNVR